MPALSVDNVIELIRIIMISDNIQICSSLSAEME